jgi:hypothetical protein
MHPQHAINYHGCPPPPVGQEPPAEAQKEGIPHHCHQRQGKNELVTSSPPSSSVDREIQLNINHKNKKLLLLSSSADVLAASTSGSGHTGNSALLSETTSTGNSAFPWRLHDMLNDAEKKGFENIVSWQQDGKGFKVHMQKEFSNIVLPSYFNQSQYKSFQRQLNIYGFSRTTIGAERGAYTHELLIRGKPDICRFMVRTKIKGKGSRSSLLQNPSSQLLKKSSAAGSFMSGSHRSASCPTNLKRVTMLNPSEVLRLFGSTTDKNEEFFNTTMQTGVPNAIFELKESSYQTRIARSRNPFLQHSGVDMKEEGFLPMLNEEGTSIIAANNASMPIRVGRGKACRRRHSMTFDPPALPEDQSYIVASPRTSSAKDCPPFWTLEESSSRSKYHIQQPSPQRVETRTGFGHEKEEEGDMFNSLCFPSKTRAGIAFDSVSDFLNHDHAGGHVLTSNQEQSMSFQYSIEAIEDDPMIPFLEEDHQNQRMGDEQDLVTDYADEIIRLLGSQKQCAENGH